MLHARISLHEITHSSDAELLQARNYHQVQCRKSAQAIVDFVVSLRSEDLKEFWLPYTAYHLTSTATLLLTCALESFDDAAAHSCILSVRRLVERLQRARDEDGWDLADLCLSQCGGVLLKMSGNQAGESHELVKERVAQDVEEQAHESELLEELDPTYQLINDTALMLSPFQSSALRNPTVDLW